MILDPHAITTGNIKKKVSNFREATNEPVIEISKPNKYL